MRTTERVQRGSRDAHLATSSAGVPREYWLPPGAELAGRVSVIMPVFNGERFLAEAISSVLGQSWRDIELIISDDGSTDSSMAIAANAAASDSRVRIVSDAGQCSAALARNRAIVTAGGEYIAFCDCDDRWLPDKLSRQVAAMKAANVACAHGSYRRIATDGSVVGNVAARKRVSQRDMRWANWIGNLTGVYHSAVVGRFFQRPVGHEDFDMWIRILAVTDSVGVEEEVAEYRTHAGNISANKFKSAAWTFAVLCRNFGVFQGALAVATYPAIALNRRLSRADRDVVTEAQKPGAGR